MAPTGANQMSSRSHSILVISVENKDRARNLKDGITYAKLQMIDLAGSERAAATENRGQRMVEGANINKSLLALGNCINILSDRGKEGSFVPYRDSKLTRLLKDSLGGNTKTIMIACISPSFLSFEETVNTLKYASRARKIKKVLTKNIKEVETHVSRYKEVIDSLRNEIEFLRRELSQQQLIRANSSLSPLKSPDCNSTTQGINLSSKSKYLKHNLTKVIHQQNTHGNSTPVRLSNGFTSLPLVSQRYKKNQATDSLLDSSSFTADNNGGNSFTEIEHEIFKTQTEKLKIQQEIMLSEKKKQHNPHLENSSQDNDDSYFEQLSHNLL